MDFANMTMGQKKMLGAAACCLMFVISLFMPWFGEGSFSRNGWDSLPSSWIWLLFGLAAAAILVMAALDMEIPIPVPPFATSFYLISIPFWVTLAYLFEGDAPGKKIGLFIGLIFSLAAAVLTVMIGREEEG